MAAEGLRERKKRERRRRIEDAALELMEQQGFDGATIEDIAAAADIAPRTFFSYFDTKEDVVVADYADRLERIVDELARRVGDEPPWVALRASFLAVAVDYETEREHLVRRFRIIARHPAVAARSLQLQAGWEDAVARVLAEQATPGSASTIEPRLLAASAVAAMRSALSHWIATGHETPLPELLQDCFDRIGSGFDSDRHGRRRRHRPTAGAAP